MKFTEVITLCIAVCALLVATITFLNIRAVQQDIKRLDKRVSAIKKMPKQAPITTMPMKKVTSDKEIEQIKKIIKTHQQEIKRLKTIVKGTRTEMPSVSASPETVRLPSKLKVRPVKIIDIESKQIEIIKRQTIEFLKVEIGLDDNQVEKIKPAVDRYAKSLRKYRTIAGIQKAQNIRIQLINEIAGYLTQEQLEKLKVAWKIEEE
jgi:hypothetical protein